MCAILFGEDVMEETPVVTGNCNGNSPLVWDEVMLGAMRAFCRRNQPVLCSPFVLGGANTPASVAPAVAQLNAEALSALAYTQVVRKGCPAIYGHYLSTVSMSPVHPWRDARDLADELHDRADGAALRRALADLEHPGRCKDLRRAGGLRGAPRPSRPCSTRAPTTSGIRPAGTRPGCTARSPSSWWTPSSAPWATAWPRGSVGTTSTRRLRRCGRRPRRPLSRAPAHPGQLRAGLLHAQAVRQQLHRAMAGRGEPGDHRPAPMPVGSTASTTSRASMRAWTRRCATTWPADARDTRQWTRSTMSSSDQARQARCGSAPLSERDESGHYED